MPEYIVLKADIKVPNGPSLSLNRTLEVDAYDKIDILLPKGQTNKLIELQQSEEPKIEFLLIKSDFYGKDLVYKLSNLSDATAFVLDEPLLLTGKGAISLFGAVPTKLYFTNSTSGDEAKDIKIEILVGRNMA